MKDIKNKIKATFLAIIVLFSSSFIVIDEHFCGGELQDFSILGKADTCNMTMSTCEFKNQLNLISEDNCCSNVQKIKAGSIFENSPLTGLNFQQLIAIPNINPNIYNLYINLTRNTLHFKDYSPPLIARNILVFIECFRI
ncbi:HYC_CC_PP family protein [Lutibacter sp.]